MLSSKGLRVSLIGGAIFLPSAVATLILPALIGSIGMLVGGLLVFGGFIVTLVQYYSGSGEGDTPDE